MAKIALVATVTEAKSIRPLTPFAQEPDRRIDRHSWWLSEMHFHQQRLNQHYTSEKKESKNYSTTLSEIFSLFFINIYYKYISYHILFKDGEKENNIFCFLILYRKERVDNDRNQGHFRGEKYYFPKNKWV